VYGGLGGHRSSGAKEFFGPKTARRCGPSLAAVLRLRIALLEDQRRQVLVSADRSFSNVTGLKRAKVRIYITRGRRRRNGINKQALDIING